MLILSSNARTSLRRHGEEVYPEESCGVLVGRIEGSTRIVIAAIPCANTRRDSPKNRYAIDPKDLIRIQREAREQGMDVVGFYHSHPDHPAQWSSIDISEAHWLGCSYVITGVTRGHAAETRSFLLIGSADKKQFEEEPMVEQTAEIVSEKNHPLS